MHKLQLLWCCGCDKAVMARLTNGHEIYPHRKDLHSLPFWRCDSCKNFVGCHHKTRDQTRPLGCIPTPALKTARKEIHAKLDPLWKSGRMERGDIYGKLSKALGREYHTADIKTLAEATRVMESLDEILLADVPQGEK